MTSAPFIQGLLDHLWQSTLFCAVVWLITCALRRNSAATRHAWWLAASLKFLVPFSALYHLGAMTGLPVSVGAQPTFFTDAVAATTPLVSPTDALVSLDSSRTSAWPFVLALLWGLGACVLASRWWLSWRAADSLARAARPAPGSSLDACITDAAIEPAVARVFHPVVLLPSALLGRLTAPQLAAVLAHEREHIARHDNLTAHLHHLVEMLFWFHPAVWWIGRQMVEERERACDEAVLDRGHDARDYAEGILAVCRCCQLSHAAGTSSALSGNLTRRIRAILRQASPVSLGFFKAFALSGAVMMLTASLLFAGAAQDAQRRHDQITRDSRVLGSAVIHVAPSPDAGPLSVVARERSVLIRNTTLPQLVALSYGVDTVRVAGADGSLDTSRYDIRVQATSAMMDAERFDPAALRGIVNRLFASRFDLEIHVDQRCQQPCGRRALLANASP